MTGLRACAAAVGIALLGCAEDEGPSLFGTWALPAGDCTHGLRLGEDGRFAESRTCEEPGGFRVEAREGTFEAANGVLTVHVLRSSCPNDAAVTRSARYEVMDSSLMLSGDFAPIYIRTAVDSSASTTDAGMLAVRFGCFDGGGFTEHPLEDL